MRMQNALATLGLACSLHHRVWETITVLLYIQVYVEINIHIHHTVPLLYAVSTVAVILL